MKTLKLKQINVKMLHILILILVFCASVSYAQSGHQDWGPWKLDWAIEMNAGLSLKNVSFNNEKVLHRASMPVIRVKYYGDYNDVAYADKLNWNNMENVGWCGNVKVCIKTYDAFGKSWLEIGIYSEIGKYQLYQAWALSLDGYINSNMFSKGLHHDADHTHHIYYRLDADIGDVGNDQTFVYANYYGNEGWGNHWHKYKIEDNDFQEPDVNPEQVYFVRDRSTGHGLWILPRQNDGWADAFSKGHLFYRQYKGLEDREWAFGAWGELEYDENEDIQEKDVVVWYVPHLFHDRADSGNHWHWAGPTLVVHR
jgi:hypothetical protein